MNQMNKVFFPKLPISNLPCGTFGKKVVSSGSSGLAGKGGTTMTDFDRARAYVARMPPAISGQGGHEATFAVAKAVIHDWALFESEAWRILLEYNARCSPPWSERELRHKMESARNLTRAKRERGALANHRPYYAAYCAIPRRQPIPATETEPRILGQVSIEMFQEPKPPVMTPAERPPDLAPQAEQTTIGRLTGQSLAEPLQEPSVAETERIEAEPENVEANRIAGELRNLNDAGALKKPEDPPFFAAVTRIFGATFLAKEAQEPPLMVDTASAGWAAKVLTGYHQPRRRKEHTAFLMAAFEPGDTFDFSNPEDSAEFEKLYPRAK
jgi:hypothetical protein